MTVPSPGWYPDPNVPLLMRWWDGEQWSSDTYERTEPMGWPAPSGGDGSGGRASGTATATDARRGAVGPAVTTPDGALLAAWWPRAAARVLDVVVTWGIALLVGWSWTRTLAASLADQVDATLRAQEAGADPAPLQYDAATLEAVLGLTLVWLAVSLVYQLVFLLRWGATPGKLAAGLRVRPWEPGQRLGVGAVARRWVAFEAASALSYVGLVYVLVDAVWPLRDVRRQALHDKLARTCVVTLR